DAPIVIKEDRNFSVPQLIQSSLVRLTLVENNGQGQARILFADCVLQNRGDCTGLPPAPVWVFADDDLVKTVRSHLAALRNQFCLPVAWERNYTRYANAMPPCSHPGNR